MSYKVNFTSRVGGLVDKFFEVRMLELQAGRLADIVFHEREDPGPPVEKRASDIEARIELRNVSYRYADSEPNVLSGCSLSIDAGDCVAIVGPSGCGKTTLVKLMLGLFPPAEGEIFVGGVSLRHLGLRSYRQMVASVMQDDQLFAGSLSDNIGFFDATPDQDWIEHCGKLAAVHDEIMRMPMGYNTLIGDMGTAISGGQKQRILLARALYKRPRILVMDEATSHLDVANERAVNLAMKDLGITRIIVAHRPETIAIARRIVVLQGGKVGQDLRPIEGRPAHEARS
jgi:ATP-binding cassette, subfamily B, bacterial CvaB/MchF/RaxB